MEETLQEQSVASEAGVVKIHVDRNNKIAKGGDEFARKGIKNVFSAHVRQRMRIPAMVAPRRTLEASSGASKDYAGRGLETVARC